MDKTPNSAEKDKSKKDQVKHVPKDAQVIISIMKELGVTDYEPRVINQLLEFTYSKVLETVHKYIIQMINFRICDLHPRRRQSVRKSFPQKIH